MRPLLVHLFGIAILLCFRHAAAFAEDPTVWPTLISSDLSAPDFGNVEQLSPSPDVDYSVGETLYKSMFGTQPDPERTWTPLTLDRLGAGWFEPWIAPPPPPGDSRRQGWVASNDAFFNRMIVGIYSLTPGEALRPQEQTGSLLFETPVTRRYMFGVFVPFTDNLHGGAAPNQTAFGDTTFENRFLLHETPNTTVSFNLNVRTPTGSAALGGDRTILSTYMALYRDIGRGFSIRGISGVDSPLDSRPDGLGPVLTEQLGIGQTLTPHDVPWFGDFTYYVMTNVRSPIDQRTTYASITPGLRTHLGHNFWLLAGVEAPVTHHRPFDERFTFVLVKGY